MERMIGICGLNCIDCPVHIATEKDDDYERKKIAEKWSSAEFPLTPEDINCEGCLVEEEKLSKFAKACEVRACGFEKNLENCAHCDEYPCEKLNNLWKMFDASEAKTTLDKIKKSLQE
jgi:hypothetical protein